VHRVEHDLKAQKRSSMHEALGLIALRSGDHPHTSMDAEQAEDKVRERIGRTSEHPLHVYGFLIHLVLYPFTILLAAGGYFSMALSASATVAVDLGLHDKPSPAQTITEFLLNLSVTVMVCQRFPHFLI